MTIKKVYLLHGKGGSPEGTVKKFETILAPLWPTIQFERPRMPHSNYETPTEDSVAFLGEMQPEPEALLVGISLGGLVAAKLQEMGREDLHVIAISSPTWADAVKLEACPERRVALYSSQDEVIAPRTSEWPQLARLWRDYPWLTHQTDAHFAPLTKLFGWYIQEELPARIGLDPLEA